MPSLKVVGMTLLSIAFGGLGTTVCYHRMLAHKTLKTNRIVEQILIFWAVFRLWPPCQLGRVSSPTPFGYRHARGHLQSQAGRLLVGTSSLALSNSARRQEALGA